MSQLRRQVEQKKLDAIRQRLQDKQETLMHMQNNKLPSGTAGDATDQMARVANEQLHRVHAAQERLLSVPTSEPVSAPRSGVESSAHVSGAGANRGFSKLNARPDLFLASAAPVAFVPPNFCRLENEKSARFLPTTPMPPHISMQNKSCSNQLLLCFNVPRCRLGPLSLLVTKHGKGSGSRHWQEAQFSQLSHQILLIFDRSIRIPMRKPVFLRRFQEL